MQQFIVAVNRMNDRITDLASEVKLLNESPVQQLTKKYLDVKDACTILHVSDRTLYKMRNNGELPYICVGRKILFRESDLEAYLESKARIRRERFRM